MKAASCQHIRRKTPEREKMTPRDQNKNRAGIKEEEAKVKRGNEKKKGNINPLQIYSQSNTGRHKEPNEK